MSSPGQNPPVVTALPAEVPGDWRMVRRLWPFSVNAAGMSLGTFLGAAIGGLGLGLGGYPGTACALAAITLLAVLLAVRARGRPRVRA